jgi:hypothetical protein
LKTRGFSRTVEGNKIQRALKGAEKVVALKGRGFSRAASLEFTVRL